jgi:hypothetical protein
MRRENFKSCDAWVPSSYEDVLFTVRVESVTISFKCSVTLNVELLSISYDA